VTGTAPAPSRRALLLAVALSGGAGLIWEVLWQQRAALAFGVSAVGTAVTLAALMLGFAAGGLAAARWAAAGGLTRPLAAYAAAEAAVALGGVLAAPLLTVLEAADTALYGVLPAAAWTVHVAGAIAVFLVPAAAMGATVPILARVASAAGTTLATVYAVNTAGALAGVLAGTFAALPLLGVTRTGLLAAGVELAVALWALRRGAGVAATPAFGATAGGMPPRLGLAFVSGAVVFALEVSWFRSVRAAFQSTTDSFAVVLAGFLLPLAIGAALAPRLRRRRPDALAWVLAAAAATVLLATPLVDQLDRVAPHGASPLIPLARLALVLAVFLLPATACGIVFPWLLDERPDTVAAGRLYAANTGGAVAGALVAAFVLLPAVGATRTSWLAAALLAATALAAASGAARRAAMAGIAALALVAAAVLDSGPGRRRAQGAQSASWRELLYSAEGPDATVSVVIGDDGERKLVIDGFLTSGEGRLAHYMRWMGHLPALAAPRLRDALVICFGTGQTADAVRAHHPGRLEIVDVSAAVLRAAPLFPANHGVLSDPAVHATVMDGRAFLRRSAGLRFDVVTLEPMAPSFAGTNNLYSREFYRLVRARLSDGGVVAQWLPFHLLPPPHMAAIVATFVEALPFARLYVDFTDGTGILVGGTRPWSLHPSPIPLDLPDDGIAAAFLLDVEGVHALAALGEPITDDNQMLAYGLERWRTARRSDLRAVNLGLVASFRRPGSRWEEAALRYGDRAQPLAAAPPPATLR
jgi:spermidine synthase